MKVKIDIKQMESMSNLLDYLMSLNDPEDMAEDLLREIVININEKIKTKVRRFQFDNRTGHNLKLTSIESKGLYLWLSQNMGYVSPVEWQYEHITVTSVIHQIDKEYA